MGDLRLFSTLTFWSQVVVTFSLSLGENFPCKIKSCTFMDTATTDRITQNSKMYFVQYKSFHAMK